MGREIDQDAPPKMGWLPVLIPLGKYEGFIFKREVKEVRRFDKKKILYLWFEILPPSQFAGSRIFRSYHYDKISPICSYSHDWIIANGGRRPERWDRMSPLIFDGKVFQITVRNVKSGFYSVVNSIDALIAGGNNDRD